MTKVIFMGTPEFAACVLRQLYKEESVEVIAVVSQPDQKIGRKQVLTATPVKTVALEHGTTVLQPRRLKEEYQEIIDLKPDMIITCAYGQIVPDDVLNCAPSGAYNLHGSLLPELRGGAPIQRAIMQGKSMTGMTLMKMVKRMDAGDMIAKSYVPIPEDYTYGMLEADLMESAAKLLHDSLPSLIKGNFSCEPQDENLVTFARNIAPEEEKVDWNRSYKEIYDHIRGLIPRPATYALIDGKTIKFWGVKPNDERTDKESGTILGFADHAMRIAAGGGVLCITELQLEGKKKCTADDFKNGAGRAMAGKVLK